MTDKQMSLLDDLAVGNTGEFWDRDFNVPVDQQPTTEIRIGTPPASTCGQVPEEMGSDLEEVASLVEASHRGERSGSRTRGYGARHSRRRSLAVPGLVVGVLLGSGCGLAGYALGSHATSPVGTSYPIYIEKTVSPPEGVATRTKKKVNDGITGTE